VAEDAAKRRLKPGGDFPLYKKIQTVMFRAARISRKPRAPLAHLKPAGGRVGGVMPLLQVNDFPHDIYEEIISAAKKENISIAQEAVILIKKGLEKETPNMERRKKVLERIMARDVPETAKDVDAVRLIREDRDK
jgi:hypothetical protein